MWEVTGLYSDISIITDDETYWEDNMKIINEIELWILWTEWEYKVIPDRWEAISFAIKNAKESDIVIVTGMWTFTSRNVWGAEEDWNDRDVIRRALGK
jgi:UDP-N-acetylmuramoyl-L-alanyl-D-glutamate--2,6-diaminopimelate ligase